MSNRAIQFLNHWATEHVSAMPYPEHLAEARWLAKECMADAKKQGISKKELEEDLLAKGSALDIPCACGWLERLP